MKVMTMELGVYRRMLLKHPKRIFNSGDHRFQDTHFCSACGFPLVTYNIGEANYSNKRKLYRIEYNGSVVYLCANAKSCRDYCNKKKGSEAVRVLLPD